jgi:hypothetical protein
MKKFITLLFLALSISAFATSVTFKVSMKGSGVEYDSIFIVGNHTDWNFVQMADEGDSLFSVTLNLPAEDSVVYYYITIGWWASNYLDFRETVPADCDASAELFGWDGDRAFVVPADPITIAYIWGTCEEPPAPSAISNQSEKFSDFELFPNPCSDIVNLSVLSITEKATIEILDISGKKVRDFETSMKNVSIDVSDLTEGLYLVKMINGNSTFVKKLVVN